MWIIYAILSAVSASLMGLFLKVGLKETSPLVCLCIRTGFVFVFTLIFALFSKGIIEVKSYSGKTWFWIVVTSVVTFSTWFFYFLALKNGNINAVTAIDRASIILTILLSFFFLHEKITFQVIMGMILLMLGTILIIMQ